MKSIAWKYGLWMAAGFTGLFLLMYSAGVAHNYNLRILNSVIHIGLLYGAISAYREHTPDKVGNYVSGVAMGMYSSVIGVLIFTLFMGLFLGFEGNLMAHIKETMPVGRYLNSFTTPLFIFVEGIAVSLIGSYLVTRIVDDRMPQAEYPTD
jgi:hypothetical protein